MLRERNCSESSCGGTAVTSLDKQALCLNHFLLRCYKKLERVDPRGGRMNGATVDLAARRAFIEECSRKTLDICLQSKRLTNLERGRLLDILLWAGELFVLLRIPRRTLAESIASSDSHLVTRAASSHF